MRVFILFVLSLLPLASLAQSNNGLPTASSPINIVASIRPLALIANDVAGDLAQVEILIPSGASPHDYAMRISDRRSLDKAQLVLWMGPSLERFLERPLANLEPQRILPLGQDVAASHAHDHSHERDLHQWLDPRLASQMAQAISERLQELLPQHKALLSSRLDKTIEQYRALHQENLQTLEPLRSRSFVVDHRGYDFLVEAYDLRQLGWISEHPEQAPSVRHLYQLEQRIDRMPDAERARCLFSERAHTSTGVVNLAWQLGLTLRSLDILGDEADTYRALMQNLVADIADCLSAATESTPAGSE